MTQLFQNSISAERDRGCIFADSFESVSEVNKNCGTISGAIPKDGGFYFDGTNDYIQYILGSEFYSSAISCIVEFTPEFNWNENTGRAFLGGSLNHSASGRILLFKYDSGSNYDILFQVHSTWVQISSATYSPYWKQNKKNTMVISATGTTTTVYLNGYKIANAVAHIWSKVVTNILNVGCLYTEPNNPFKGIIHSLKIYNRALSDQECLDYCNNSVFNYNDKATLILPMTNRYHDPANAQTLDATKNGNHFRLGDGVTANTFPTKLTRSKGYSKNPSGNSYFQHANIPTLFSRPFAISILLNINNWAVSPLLFNQSNGTSYSIQNYLNCDNSSGAIYFAAYNGGYISMANFNIPNKPRGLMHLVLNYKDLTTPTGKCWFNGRDVTTGFTSTGEWFNNNEQFLLGCYYPGIQHLRENIYDFRIWDGMALTELQIKDLYHNLLRELNRV